MTALEVVKSDLQNKTAIILIKDDAAAKKLLVAWTIYATGCLDFTIKGHEFARDLLAKLWDTAPRVDMAVLAGIAGIPETKARVIFERLRAANLIWPDGTVPANVEAFLIGEVGYYANSLLPRGGQTNGQRGRYDTGRGNVSEPDNHSVHPGSVAGPGTSPARRSSPGKNSQASQRRAKTK